MFIQIMQRIISLENKVLEQGDELEDLRGNLANLIRLAVVEKASKTTVDIKTGDNEVKDVPFFVFCSGKVSHYRRPSVGELCLLVNLGSGTNLNNAVALMGLPSSKYPAPTTKENEVMVDYGNGMTELYDIESGKLVAKYPGGYEIHADSKQIGKNELEGDSIQKGNQQIEGDTKQKGNIEATKEISDGVRSMSEDRNLFNAHDHICSKPGDPSMPPGVNQ
ncbi:phage baseplate assembly protein V [Aliivibrio sp. EL58]|uniref:phage baseplate assembly protein V n=1 Tax=Aliivibrio sp. EL58 TaxID=2107582 RepID=UPI000EFBDE11|nr:phage baseplate assembly protein V [Aliivibrio sp. EL58]